VFEVKVPPQVSVDLLWLQSVRMNQTASRAWQRSAKTSRAAKKVW